MNEAEKDVLAEFEENDKELENIAAQICGALDTLKGTAENIEKQVKDQGKLLKKTNQRAGDAEAQLTQDNNELKSIIAKHKNCKQMGLDICLLVILIVLIGMLVKMLEYKGII